MLPPGLRWRAKDGTLLPAPRRGVAGASSGDLGTRGSPPLLAVGPSKRRLWPLIHAGPPAVPRPRLRMLMAAVPEGRRAARPRVALSPPPHGRPAAPLCSGVRASCVARRPFAASVGLCQVESGMLAPRTKLLETAQGPMFSTLGMAAKRGGWSEAGPAFPPAPAADLPLPPGRGIASPPPPPRCTRCRDSARIGSSPLRAEAPGMSVLVGRWVGSMLRLCICLYDDSSPTETHDQLFDPCFDPQARRAAP